MNKIKKRFLGIIKKLGAKKSKKKEKFDNKVLNLTLQKIDNDCYKFDGKAVYSADMSVLVYVFNTDEKFTIPEGVEIIGMMAFRNKKFLKNVIIPSSVKVIEKNAFYGCDDLDKVIIPDTVKSVKANAFTACDNLQTVTFSGVLKDLNRHAFDDSDNLRLIIVPSGSVKTYCKALHINNNNTKMSVVEKEIAKTSQTKDTDRKAKKEKTVEKNNNVKKEENLSVAATVETEEKLSNHLAKPCES